MAKIPSVATLKTWDVIHAERGSVASHANANRSPLCHCGRRRYRKYTLCREHHLERRKGQREKERAPRCPNCTVRFGKVKYGGLCAECSRLGQRAFVKRGEKPTVSGVGSGNGKANKADREFATALKGLRPDEETRCPKCHEQLPERRLLWRGAARGGHSCRGRND